ncbi:MAG: hypothetical protein B6U87_02790, partial [Candidatus Aenigmarchaeota archaeon ex4484_52]
VNLGIREGDAIELQGQKASCAIAVRAYPSDSNLDIVRIDGITRKNIGATVGDKITITPIKNITEADFVKLKPLNKNIVFEIPKNELYHLFNGRIIKKGDIICPVSPKQQDLIEAIEQLIGVELAEFISVGFQNIHFVVFDIKPSEKYLRITKNTNIAIAQGVFKKKYKTDIFSYEDVGGLKNEIKKIREIIDIPVNHPEIFNRLGISPPKGILLYGAPGCGKTLIAKAVANESRCNFIMINGPEITSKWIGDSEKRIRQIFKEAQSNAPCIIFIDEIDAITPKRDDVYNEVDKRLVAQFLSCMDGLNTRNDVIVMAATNRPDSLDSALRRPGRFDREIEISPPNTNARCEILKIHSRYMPLDKNVDFKKISQKTYGYVGADLEALCKEAALIALRRLLPKLDLKNEELTKKELEKIFVSNDDFKTAMQFVEPSALREVMIEIPKTTWNDVGGLEDIKQKLKEVIEWPILHPERFKKMGIKPSHGVLLYGLPGVGKTLLVKAVANQTQANFISIKASDLLSKWVGEGEKYIKELFKRARQVAPCIIFIDEIDAIARKRGSNIEYTDSLITQFLTEIDGLEGLKGVILVAATNRPDLVDSAFMRNGRFDRHIYVPVPDAAARKKIFDIYTKKMPLDKGIDVGDLIEKTKNFVGADIENLCRETALKVLRENLSAKTIMQNDFIKTLEKFKSSITEKDIKEFEQIIKKTKALQIPNLNYFG